jgi:hypothetical protein
MRFLLSLLVDGASLPDSKLSNKCFGEMMDFVDELNEAGQLLFDSQVLPDPPAMRLVQTDGEVREGWPPGKEMLGGFFVISAATHADALAIAKRCPHHQVGAVELRALNEKDENAYQ